MDKKVIIATHDGMFHADDVFAVASLLCLLDKTPVLATIARTRVEEMIRKADFVVDVGSIDDAEKNRFDHHQIGGAGKRVNGISYASFGLVWKKFGKDIAGNEEVARIVDKNLVASIDADDSGIDLYKKVFVDTVPYTIGDFIHNLRPTWQEPADVVDSRFLEAVSFGRKVLEREIAFAKASLAGEVEVRASYEKAEDKRIVVLDVFYSCEALLANFREPLFVVFPRPDGSWAVKTVRDDISLFKNRKNLPKEWAGKRDHDLAQITGVPDAIFCHNGLFMAVAKSKEGVIALAKLALNS